MNPDGHVQDCCVPSMISGRNGGYRFISTFRSMLSLPELQNETADLAIGR